MSLNVLEHLDHDKKVFQELVESLELGGFLRYTNKITTDQKTNKIDQPKSSAT